MLYTQLTDEIAADGVREPERSDGFLTQMDEGESKERETASYLGKCGPLTGCSQHLPIVVGYLCNYRPSAKETSAMGRSGPDPGPTAQLTAH